MEARIKEGIGDERRGWDYMSRVCTWVCGSYQVGGVPAIRRKIFLGPHSSGKLPYRCEPKPPLLQSATHLSCFRALCRGSRVCEGVCRGSVARVGRMNGLFVTSSLSREARPMRHAATIQDSVSSFGSTMKSVVMSGN